MNTFTESTKPKLDQLGVLAALSASIEKFSSLQEADQLSEWVVRMSVEEFGISSAWLYGAVENKEPLLRASYPQTEDSANYQLANWCDEDQIRALVGRTMYSLIPGLLCNPNIGDSFGMIQTAGNADVPNIIVSFPLICGGAQSAPSRFAAQRYSFSQKSAFGSFSFTLSRLPMPFTTASSQRRFLKRPVNVGVRRSVGGQ